MVDSLPPGASFAASQRHLRPWMAAVLCALLWTGCGLHKVFLPNLRPLPVPLAGSDRPQFDHLQVPEENPSIDSKLGAKPKGSWFVLVGAALVIAGYAAAELAGAEIAEGLLE